MKKTLIALAILFLCASSVAAQLKPTSFTSTELVSLDPKQAINLLTDEQEELYQKVFRDYLRTFVKDHLSSQEIINNIYQQIISTEAWTNVRNFMIKTLFNKFGNFIFNHRNEHIE